MKWYYHNTGPPQEYEIKNAINEINKYDVIL